MNDMTPPPADAPAHQPARATPATVAQAFIDLTRRYADREAIRVPGEFSLSYAELERRVAEAVALLDELGLRPGDRIGLCLPNGPYWPVLTFAAALSGLCVVPINIRYRAEELEHALRGARVRLLVTVSRFLSNAVLERLREVAGGALGDGARACVAALPALEHIVIVDDAADPDVSRYDALIDGIRPARDLAQRAAQRNGDEPMWLFWTSGSSSRPKAALMPQSTIEIVWQWTSLAGYRADDRVLTARPLFYIAGHFWSMLGPLLHGACCVIARHFTPEETVRLCSTEGISVLSGNPLMFKRLIEDPAFKPTAFASVRLGYFSGSALSADDMQRICGLIGFRHLLHTYGMTELGGFIMSTRPEDSIRVACESCGTPFTPIELKLADVETDREVPRGEVGQLLVRGQKLIRYENLDAAEQARFYDAQGWYRTGDLMRQLPDGRYQLTGRAKDLIKVGGENVTAAEIEQALMRHPDIVLASVVAQPDADRGEVPVAFVELVPHASLPALELSTWCRAHMAPFKVPAEFHQIQASAWPMTSSGKIAKHELLGAQPSRTPETRQ